MIVSREIAPEQFAAQLRAAGRRRAWWASSANPSEGEELRASAPELLALGRALARCPDFDRHEAVFLEVGAETGTLLGAFLHRSRRGQGQGGVRHWPYARLEDFLHDGLRLSRAMSRKCALAGLWWGGAKGVIARADRWRDAGYRRALYADYGRFVSALRGAYVTAEDVGTTPDDMAQLHRHTRFATCVPPAVGGSGNPAGMTAAGVVCAMEAALDALGLGALAGRTLAVQGAGAVGAAMLDLLLERGIARIVVSDASPERCAALRARGDARLEVREVDPDDVSILAEPCDVLAPSALGGVLGPETIARVRARVVCGAANNPLRDDVRDARLLAARGVAYVPDFVANRMGIVACSNEQYGSLPDDPAVLRHLSPACEDGIPATVRRLLDEARARGETPLEAAHRLADARVEELHPVWADRARHLVASLIRDRWEEE